MKSYKMYRKMNPLKKIPNLITMDLMLYLYGDFQTPTDLIGTMSNEMDQFYLLNNKVERLLNGCWK
jgi:hypothetical protein